MLAHLTGIINSALEKSGLKRKKSVYVIITKDDGSEDIITKDELHKGIGKTHEKNRTIHSMSRKSKVLPFTGGRRISLDTKLAKMDMLMKNDYVHSNYSKTEMRNLLEQYDGAVLRGGKRVMDLDVFINLVGLHDNGLASALWRQYFDPNNTGTCSRKAFLGGFNKWREMFSDPSVAILVTFRLFDKNGDGVLTVDEFNDMLRGSRSLDTFTAIGGTEPELKELQEHIDDIANDVFNFLNKTNVYTCKVNRTEMQTYLEKHPKILTNTLKLTEEEFLLLFDLFDAHNNNAAAATGEESQHALCFDQLNQLLLSSQVDRCPKAMEDRINKFSRAVFGTADVDKSGEVDFEEFAEWVENNKDAVNFLNNVGKVVDNVIIPSTGQSSLLGSKKSSFKKSKTKTTTYQVARKLSNLKKGFQIHKKNR